MSNDNLSTSDYLAIERTNLANERTLLAYIRTFIILISSGFAIIKIDFLKEINMLGIILLIVSPFVLIFGIYRFYSMSNRIKRHYQKEE
ncbi:MAG: DUF202 domain-containing protein [Tenuifilaceae bacterium]